MKFTAHLGAKGTKRLRILALSGVLILCIAAITVLLMNDPRAYFLRVVGRPLPSGAQIVSYNLSPVRYSKNLRFWISKKEFEEKIGSIGDEIWSIGTSEYKLRMDYVSQTKEDIENNEHRFRHLSSENLIGVYRKRMRSQWMAKEASYYYMLIYEFRPDWYVVEILEAPW